MWSTAFIRFLRRRIILGLIFSLSLLYCIFSYVGKGEDGDEAPPIRRTQPFIWRTLQQHNLTIETDSCRNSIQGKVLIVDDRGFVCPRKEILSSGCCNSTAQTSLQYTCETCKSSNACCAIYEYCISCCLHPDKRQMLETVLGRAQEENSVLFASVGDHFELCLAKCRTNSQSVQHENSYKDPKAKHCYGDLPPGSLQLENEV